MGKNSSNNAIATRLAQSLSFEVEATPQENVIQFRNAKNMTPVNVKIRVRRKENHSVNGFISVPNIDEPDTSLHKIRLASSDHTIVSFSMLMEAENVARSPDRKTKRKFFGIPAFCLGTQPNDDDDSQYLPSSIKEMESISDTQIQYNIKKIKKLRNKSPLSKNADLTSISTTSSKQHKRLFGKCKPGGCLDPPLDEDQYAYKPILIPETSKDTEKDKGKTAKDKVKTEKDKDKTEKDKGKTEKDKVKTEEGKGKTDKGSYLDPPLDEDQYAYKPVLIPETPKDSEKDKRKTEKDKGKTEKDKGKTEKDKGKTEKDKGKNEKDADDSQNKNTEPKKDDLIPPKGKICPRKEYIDDPNNAIETDSIITYPPTLPDGINDDNVRRNSSRKSFIQDECQDKYYRPDRKHSETSQDKPPKKVCTSKEKQSDSSPKIQKLKSKKIPGLLKIDDDTVTQDNENVNDYNNLRPEMKSGNSYPIDISAEKFSDNYTTAKETPDLSPTKNNVIIPSDTSAEKRSNVDKNDGMLMQEKPRDSSPKKTKIVPSDSPTEKYGDVITHPQEMSHESSPQKEKMITSTSPDSSPKKTKIVRSDSPPEKREDVDKNDNKLPQKRPTDSPPQKENMLSSGSPAEKYGDVITHPQEMSHESSPQKEKMITSTSPAEKYEGVNKDVIIFPHERSRDSSPQKEKIATSKIPAEKREDADREVIKLPEIGPRDSSPKKTKIVPSDIPAEKYKDIAKDDKLPQKGPRDSSPKKTKIVRSDSPPEKREDVDKNDNKLPQKRPTDSPPQKENMLSSGSPAEKYEDLDKDVIQSPQEKNRSLSPEKKKIETSDKPTEKAEILSDSTPKIKKLRSKKIPESLNIDYDTATQDYEDMNDYNKFRPEMKSGHSYPIDISAEKYNDNYITAKETPDLFPTKNELIKPSDSPAEKRENVDKNDIIYTYEKSRDLSPKKEKIQPSDTPAEKREDLNKDDIKLSQKRPRDSPPKKEKIIPSEKREHIDKDDIKLPQKLPHDSPPKKEKIVPSDSPAETYEDVDKDDIKLPQRRAYDSPPKKANMVSSGSPTEKYEGLDKDVNRRPQDKNRSSSPEKKEIEASDDSTTEKGEGIEKGAISYPHEKSRDLSPKKEKIVPSDTHIEKRENMNKDDIKLPQKRPHALPPKKEKIVPSESPAEKYEDEDKDDIKLPQKRPRDSPPQKENIISSGSPAEKYKDLDKDVNRSPKDKNRSLSPENNKLEATDHSATEKGLGVEKGTVMYPHEKSRDSSPKMKKIVSSDSDPEKYDAVYKNVISRPQETPRESSPQKENIVSLDTPEKNRSSLPEKSKIKGTDSYTEKGDGVEKDDIVYPHDKSRDPNKRKMATSKSPAETYEDIDNDVITFPQERSHDSSSQKEETEPSDSLAQKYEVKGKNDISPPLKTYLNKSTSKENILTDVKNKDIIAPKTKETQIPIDHHNKYSNQDTQYINDAVGGQKVIETVFIAANATQDENSEQSEVTPKQSDAATIELDLDNLNVDITIQNPNEVRIITKPETDLEINYVENMKNKILKDKQDTMFHKDFEEKEEMPSEPEDINNYEVNVSVIQDTSDGQPESSYIHDSTDAQQDELSNKSEHSEDTTTAVDDLLVDGLEEEKERKLHDENDKPSLDMSDLQKNDTLLDNKIVNDEIKKLKICRPDVKDEIYQKDDKNVRVNDSTDAQQDDLSNKSERREDATTAVGDLLVDRLEEEKERKSHNENDKPSLNMKEFQKTDTFLDNKENTDNNVAAVPTNNVENIYTPSTEDQGEVKNMIYRGDKNDGTDQKYDKNQYDIAMQSIIENAKEGDGQSMTSREERKSLTRSPIIEMDISPTEQVDKEFNADSVIGSQNKEDIIIKPFEDSKHGDVKLIDDRSNKQTFHGDEINKTEDSIFLNLAFQTNFVEDRLVVQTIDSSVATDSKNVTFVRSLVRSPNKNICVPIDPNHTMSIEIKSSGQGQRKSKIPKPICPNESGKSVCTSGRSLQDISSSLQLVLASIHDQDLVPLQEIIKELKIDIDQLADQQVKFREKLCPGPRRQKPQIITAPKPPGPRCCLKRC